MKHTYSQIIENAESHTEVEIKSAIQQRIIKLELWYSEETNPVIKGSIWTDIIALRKML